MCSIFDKLMGRIGVTGEPVSREGSKKFTLLCIIFIFHEKGTPFVFFLLTNGTPFTYLV